MSASAAFDAALDAYASILAAEQNDPAIDDRCVSILRHHGEAVKRALVVFHGFTNCPCQFSELAELLAGAGYNVYVPRLPRHGLADKLTTALAELTLEELTACASDAARLAAGLGATTSALGLSLGATMAAWLAQFFPLERAVAIAPFFSVAHVATALEPALSGALGAAPNIELWWDPRARERALPDHGYPRFSTHALGRCLALGAQIRTQASGNRPRAARGTLVLNPRDPAIDNDAARDIWALWRKHGALADEVDLEGIDARHDVIEPQTYPQARTLVYPVVLRLFE